MDERTTIPTEPCRGGPAAGIMLALLLSAPVWLGLGLWLWLAAAS